MFGLTTTRRLRQEVAAANAETDRQRQRAETAEGHAATAVFNRKQVLRQLASADAANRRLHDRNLELGRRISQLAEADPDHLAKLEQRVNRLRKVGARILGAYTQERQRADLMQAAADLDHRKAIEDWEQQAKAHTAWATVTEPLIEGGQPRPTHPALVLQRALNRCQALEQRLAAAEGRTRKGVTA